MYSSVKISSAFISRQPVAAGNGLFQFLKSFCKDTTVGLAKYLFKFDRNKITLQALAVNIMMIQNTLSNKLNKLEIFLRFSSEIIFELLKLT